MEQLLQAESGIRTELEKNDSRELTAMLGAIKAVQARHGETNHIFEIEALAEGLRLHKQQKRAN